MVGKGKTCDDGDGSMCGSHCLVVFSTTSYVGKCLKSGLRASVTSSVGSCCHVDLPMLNDDEGWCTEPLVQRSP